MTASLRNIPALHEVLASSQFAGLLEKYPRDMLVGLLRTHLQTLRQKIQEGIDVSGELELNRLADQMTQILAEQFQPRLRAVINATGILLHTNLGRAPMAEEAVTAAGQAAQGYVNLELDLQTGKRSHRPDVVRRWLKQLLGCESATIVNNNAAATVIVLRALAQGREAIVSRGELVEIGGSFRIPEIMAVSGAVLKEVGSTNITRIRDYERAITLNTGVLLRVHCSNYRIEGHTETPKLGELVELGKRTGIPVVDDIGSGALMDMKAWGLEVEPLATASLRAGADLVMFSGDKLLGGPQSGIIAGKTELIEKIERDPLMRAFRVDKMTLAALEATLRLYLDPEKALQAIPHFRMLETPLAVLQERSHLLARYLGNIPGVQVHITTCSAYVGGGTLPSSAVPSIALVLSCDHLSDQELAQRLRLHQPAIMGRIESGAVLLDLRTVLPEQDAILAEAVRQVIEPSA